MGLMYRVRNRISLLGPDTEIMAGDARGVDEWALMSARLYGLTAHPPYRADWEKHGKKAGILRNLEMLNAQPDLVLAFWDGKSKGTKHTVDEAGRRGIPVEVVRLSVA